MSPPSDRGPVDRRRPGRLPILMSAFAFPGVGQFLQRRWLAGGLFSLSFLFFCAMFFIHAARILIAFYSFWLHFDTYEPPQLPWRQVAVYFLISLALYIASLVDAYLGYRRACTAWARARRGATGFGA